MPCEELDPSLPLGILSDPRNQTIAIQVQHGRVVARSTRFGPSTCLEPSTCHHVPRKYVGLAAIPLSTPAVQAVLAKPLRPQAERVAFPNLLSFS